MNTLTIPEYTTSIEYRAEISTSGYGNLQPTLYVRFAATTPGRAIGAVLHLLASRLEWITPPRERWIVNIERRSDLYAWIYLELSEATPEEAERGLARLKQLVTWR